MERIKEALERSRREREDQLSSDERREDAEVTGATRDRDSDGRTKVIQFSEKRLLKNRVIAVDHDHWAAAAYDVLRTQLLQRMKAYEWRTVAITSAAPAEGKSLTAVNLAISIAKGMGNTALLVDLDLRRASIASYFHLKVDLGLVDHILKKVPLQQILVNPGIDDLAILPSGISPIKASDLLRSPEMVAFSNELKTRYSDRYIIFDLPPLLVGDDALSFLPCVDCVLLVIEDGKSSPDEVTRAAELLQDTALIGSVLNKSTRNYKRNYYRYY